jgi:hypothetical protein
MYCNNYEILLKEYQHIIAEYTSEERVLQMKAEMKFLAVNNELRNNKENIIGGGNNKFKRSQISFVSYY